MTQQKKAQFGARRKRGFERTSSLLEHQIRSAGESRGFAVSRVVTHWAEIVGAETASMCRPVKISYGRGGFGATLTLLTTGPRAPVLQMEIPRIKEQVNACYGYAAISHIRVTQSASTGFAEGKPTFAPASTAREIPEPPAEVRQVAARTTEGVADNGLRIALSALGSNILNKQR